jgi:hypothetical protein
MGNLAAATVPTFNETDITVYPSIRKKVGKTWVLAKVGIRMVSGEQNDSISGSLTAGQNVTDPTYWAFGALTSVYRRSYSMECSIDGDATGFGGLLCAAYPIKPNVWFKAGVGLDGYPLSGSGTFAQVDNITSNGGTAPVTTKQTQTYNMDYDRTAGGMLGGATLEAYPTPSLMVAGGLIYQSMVTSVDYSETGNQTVNDAVITYNAGREATYDQTVNTINIPIGLEWKATSWLSARVGATHKIITTDESMTMTVTTYDATGNVINVADLDYTMTFAALPAVGVPVPATATTTYYSGVGFNISNNLTVDVTNVATGVNVLDMNNWQLGATLMFQ